MWYTKLVKSKSFALFYKIMMRYTDIDGGANGKIRRKSI